ncbi:Nucleoid occlusion factor SlmA [Ephemeroptericola cinctiostellae]|uniref:Nucleoid occlusion factor SlmA n=1 Tax=Ephemeroptericola cinctiostellae TaxID=2268024 RepID=A0A345D847_9BURK|nr:nucleoid occlusion factor SlmA [Ephemeroptericola cinctiostellae]AXF84535.1 Nucleoid occlusion factor SlmA [Ephemeroptericola cinctiostellae]
MDELPEQDTAKKTRPAKGERRIQILQTLAHMLENPAGDKITTAGLAKSLGVSEAALYRHFASKAQMFEGLIEFIESSLFGLLNQIAASDVPANEQLKKMVLVLLVFAQKNPGMARVMIGDALVNEHERLQQRITQLIERLSATLKQTLRNAAAEGLWMPAVDVGVYSDVLMSWVVGRWHGFVRSGFKRMPDDAYDAAWFTLNPMH